MRYIAAYLLLQLGGNSSPSASEIKQLLSVVGIEAEDDRLEKFLSGVQGKDLQELKLIAEVSTKLSWVASEAGGAGAAFAASNAIDDTQEEREVEEFDEEIPICLFDG
ncbi:hypothetical protein C8J55DRAFT_497946 [Lentinula edodes]|uniref:Ribosomal protein 60S n=1 Tax=Lentinula lateritia TaxID=40482 RepID=A0A9W9B0G3_9AGAR|nr:hypothetical protein C8J55DRAFT_497946 [Lentinula edodes]